MNVLPLIRNLLIGTSAVALLGGPMASLVRANESVTTSLDNGITCSATGGHENVGGGANFLGFGFHLNAGGSTGLPQDAALQACQLRQFVQDPGNFAAYAAAVIQQEEEDVAEAIVFYTILLLGEGPGGGISFEMADRLRQDPLRNLPLVGVLLRNGGEAQTPATPVQTAPVSQPTTGVNSTLRL